MTYPNSDKSPELPHPEATLPEKIELGEAQLNDISLDGLLAEIFNAPRATHEATERILRRISGNSSDAPPEVDPTSEGKARVITTKSRFSAADLELAIQSAQRDRRSKVDESRSRKATRRRRAILTLVSTTGIAASLMTAAFLVWKSSPNASNPSVGGTDSATATNQSSPLTDSSSAENRIANSFGSSIAHNTSEPKPEVLPGSSDSRPSVASPRPSSDSEIASSIGSSPTNSSTSNRSPHPDDPTLSANNLSRSAMNAQTEPPANLLSNQVDAGLVGNGLINTAAISVINHQFEDMWKDVSSNSSNLRLSTPNAISEQHVASRPDLLVNRIASLLIGRLPTSSELEAIRQENLLKTRSISEDHAQWVDAIAYRWLASDEFSHTWGNALSNFYRGGYPIDNADREQAREFDDWLTEQVKLNASLRDIQKQALRGISDKTHPSRFLVDHWSKLAQAAPSKPTSANASSAKLSAPQQAKARNGKIAPESWIGLNENESTVLTGLTNLFLQVTDNPMLACSQCHQQSQPLNDANPSANFGGEVAVITSRTAKPVSYGSISALLLNVLESNNRELFAKDDEDRAVKLTPAFPNGKRASATDTVDTLLTTWVEEGSHSQRGLVNSLWKSFFAVPLVAPEERFGSTSTSSREELLNYISQQASDHNASVRQLVYWMLHSAPTLQPEITLDIQNVIALSQEDLQSLRTRIELQHVLVHRPRRGSSVEEFVNQLLPVQQEIQDRALLAQPSSSQSSNKKKPNTTDRITADGLSREDLEMPAGEQIGKAQLIYGAPSVQVADLATRLSESPLSEAELIEHTYGVLRGRKPSSAEQAIWSASRLKEFAKPEATLRIFSGVSAFEYPNQ